VSTERMRRPEGVLALAAACALAATGCPSKPPPSDKPATAPADKATAPPADHGAASPAGADGDGPGRVTKGGVHVDFSLVRTGEGSAQQGPPIEGDYAEVRFKISDASSGQPMPGLKPAAWMDIGYGIAGKGGEQRDCKDKVSLYIKGIVGIRPLVDLNSYYLLLMNKDPTISVIDPVVSMTGSTSLYTQVLLKKSPADWARGGDGRRLFVSMPRANEVAVVDVENFKLLGTVPAGENPTRVAVQPDGRYLWVGNDARTRPDSGVTVIDTEKLTVAKRIETGRGHHEIAFSADDRWAFVTNRDEGTVSVVDVRKLRKEKDLQTGPVPISVAFSPLSAAAYVADGKDGTISVIDATTLEVAARVQAKPGLGPMRFTQDGRFGFVVNPAENAVHVVDASDNRLVHTFPVPGKPYQVVLTRAFAYVRLLDSERVQMINLNSIGEGKTPSVQSFPAGAGAPKLGGELGLADSIAPANLEAAVFVTNPADGNTYYYMEGMNAPMGNFRSYGHRIAAATVVDRSLKEVEPGQYAARLRLPVAGKYDVAFFIDNPKLLHCFFAEVPENPALHKEEQLEVEYLDLPSTSPPGAKLAVRFRLVDPRSKKHRAGLKDATIRYFMAPGQWRDEVPAREVEEGLYEATVAVPKEGIYYLYVGAPSAKLGHNDRPFRTLDVSAGATGGAASTGSTGKEQDHAAKAR